MRDRSAIRHRKPLPLLPMQHTATRESQPQVDKQRLTAQESHDGTGSSLLHVHVCIHCNNVRRREEVDNRELASGILHCPECGVDSPLNVEFRELPALG